MDLGLSEQVTERSLVRMRLPDFLIIGAMKSGTTSLYRWLGEQPEIWLPSVKEPNFFSMQDAWARGLEWYGALFDGAPVDALAGEASVSYSDPRLALTAARVAALVPAARLIYVVRQPCERLRSHYRHEVQRGREGRSLADAVAEPGNPYLARSLYSAALAPYLDRLPSEQISVVRFEDLVSDDHPAWGTILRHLGLPDRPRPPDIHNATGTKDGFTKPMLWLWERGILKNTRKLPGPVRMLGKAILMRRGPSYERRMTESASSIPIWINQSIWEDAQRLQAMLGLAKPLWPAPSEEPGNSEDTQGLSVP